MAAGQREHDVIVRHRQQLGLAGRQATPLRRCLGTSGQCRLRAGVVGDGGYGRSPRSARHGRQALRCGSARFADITFSCSRLTWPALAWRHAGPWSRKIIRNLQSRARHARASAGWPDLPELERDVLQWAHDFTDRLGGDRGYRARGWCPAWAVTEQHLDYANIDVLLQEVSSEAVPQRVQRDALVDLRHLRSRVTGAIELAKWSMAGLEHGQGNSQPRGRAGLSTRSAAVRAGAATA